MRNVRTLTILGLSAAALVGLAGFAAAQSRAHSHVLTVRLPGGGVEQIHYRGDIAPRVIVSAQAAPIVLASPVAAPFDWAAPFALMDQIADQMDRQSAAMLQQLDAVTAPGMQATAFGAPAMSQGYAFAASLMGKGVCGHSVQVTSTGDGKPAHVVSRSWGDCTAAPAAKPAPASQAVQTKAPQPAPARKLSI